MSFYRKNKKKLVNSTSMHEANYARLVRVIPYVETFEAGCTLLTQAQSSQQNLYQLQIAITEQTPYTTIVKLSLKHQSTQQSPWLPEMHICLRAYHDARVAEVVSFQQHRHFQPNYAYPNPAMHHINEKHQVNLFVGEWLDFCVKKRITFEGKNAHIQA